MGEFDRGLHSPEVEEVSKIAYRNYHRAAQYVDAEAKKKGTCVTEPFITKLHQICLGDILFDDEIGRYRRENVSILRASVSPPDFTRVPELMHRYITDFKDKLSGCEGQPSLKKVASSVDLLAWGHYVFIRIHPFSDGNGRVARLCCDFLCRKFDLRPIIWPRDRKEYINALEAVNKSGNLDHLGTLVAKSLRKRYGEKGGGLMTSKIGSEINRIIEVKTFSVAQQESGRDLTNIWGEFENPCFT